MACAIASASQGFTFDGGLAPAANLASPAQRLAGVRIGIDPGHGGADTGAVGPGLGLTEEAVNLATALALKGHLEAEGATVVMTRTSDLTVSLAARSTHLVNNRVDLTISVHHNGGVPSANTTMAFIYCDRPMATRGALASRVVQRLGFSTGIPISQGPASTAGTLCSGRTDWRTALPGVGQANLHMVREPETQAGILSILAEVSFITNPAEEAKLAKAGYAEGNGWAIYAGVADYFGFIPTPREGAATVATVATLPANGVTSNSARLWGRIMNDGGAPILERRLEWGIPPGWTDFSSGVAVVGNDYYFDLGGLMPGTGYQYRAWAKNSAGWSSSGAGTFTTEAATYTVVVNASPTGGGVVGGGGTFAAGSSRAVSATANGGWMFVNWTEEGGAVSGSATHVFTLNGNRNLTANFESLPPAAVPRLSGARLVDGVLSFALSGEPGRRFVVEISSDLVAWSPALTNVVPAGGEVVVTDPTRSDGGTRFYRARLAAP